MTSGLPTAFCASARTASSGVLMAAVTMTRRSPGFASATFCPRPRCACDAVSKESRNITTQPSVAHVLVKLILMLHPASLD